MFPDYFLNNPPVKLGIVRDDSAPPVYLTPNNGWTIIKMRSVSDGDLYNMNDVDFENGIGAPNQSFWIGAKYIHFLTSLPNHLERVALRINLPGSSYYLPNFQLQSTDNGYTFDDKGESWKVLFGDDMWIPTTTPLLSNDVLTMDSESLLDHVMYEIARFPLDD